MILQEYLPRCSEKLIKILLKGLLSGNTPDKSQEIPIEIPAEGSSVLFGNHSGILQEVPLLQIFSVIVSSIFFSETSAMFPL